MILQCFNKTQGNGQSNTMSWKNGKASLQRIVWKAKPYEALDATLEKNFILKHEEIVEPDYVLKVFFFHFDVIFIIRFRKT